MVKITGANSAQRRLVGLAGREKVLLVGNALYAAGEEIRAEAHISITQNSVSGKNHVPSKPGKPPSNDTGTLVSHINTIQTAPLRVEVESVAPYAAALEYGTSKMAARPYMGPSARKKRKRAVALVEKAITIATRKKG